jgi:hypothetical protein
MTGSQKHDGAQNVKKQMRLRRVKELVQGETARSWLAISPMLFIFLVVEWLLVNNLGSFTQVVNFVGVVAVAVMAGAFPVLLLLASRRKGENVPNFILHFLGNPLVAGVIYLVAVSILFLHGLFIWQNPFQRLVAIVVGVVVLVMTYLMVRKGVFARRVVIEVRKDSEATGQAEGTFMVTDSGQRATQARVELSYPDGERIFQAASGVIPEFSGLCCAKFHLAGTKAQELRVWLHRVTPDGQSENLPALVKVSSGEEVREFQTDVAGKQFVLLLRDATKEKHKGSPDEVGDLEVEVQLAAQNNSRPMEEAM